LIRVSYGDYDLNTIPPGRAIEVKCKDLAEMKKKGPLFEKSRKEKTRGVSRDDEGASAVEWVNYS